MKTILLFGAGKSTTVLIDYILKNALIEHWHLVLADANLELAQSKIGSQENASAVSLDINNIEERVALIQKADLVISMMPPALHILIARDCIAHKKHLLTASYLDKDIKELQNEIEASDVLFLYEMGLDPGIDHMSAMKLFNEIKEQDGTIDSFKSHCGGLVAPESDDNPWHYKISWNPRNIILAGKAGAHYLENGNEKNEQYEELFKPERIINVPEVGTLSWYPNRDSLGYLELYDLKDVSTFVRTTLRHPDFMFGWKNVVDLKLTDETKQYDTDGKTFFELYEEHFNKQGFGDWLNNKFKEQLTNELKIVKILKKINEDEIQAAEEDESEKKGFILADTEGNLKEFELFDVKIKTAEQLSFKIRRTNLLLKQLDLLGIIDQHTKVNKGICSFADIIQYAAEKNLVLQPNDKDMIVMLHEIEAIIQGRKSSIKSSLVVKGENSLHTAMAKTVGLPLAIAAKLILNGTIKLTGLHVPTLKQIYEPVLVELETLGIKFHETISTE